MAKIQKVVKARIKLINEYRLFFSFNNFATCISQHAEEAGQGRMGNQAQRRDKVPPLNWIPGSAPVDDRRPWIWKIRQMTLGQADIKMTWKMTREMATLRTVNLGQYTISVIGIPIPRELVSSSGKIRRIVCGAVKIAAFLSRRLPNRIANMTNARNNGGENRNRHRIKTQFTWQRSSRVTVTSIRFELLSKRVNPFRNTELAKHVSKQTAFETMFSLITGATDTHSLALVQYNSTLCLDVQKQSTSRNYVLLYFKGCLAIVFAGRTSWSGFQ